MTKPRPKTTLSPVGASAERVLEGLLRDVKEDLKSPADKRRYTLTDHMKIIDRVVKFEAIKSRIKEDDEGTFFKNDPSEGAEDETE